MALVYDNSTLALSVNSTLAKAQRFVSHWFQPPQHSPEGDLLKGPLRDARLAPRAPMSNAEIDVGLLTKLSSIGLKRAKLVSDQSHPELMQAWKIMAARAGCQATPQLIIAESDSLNALTINRDEVTITTGLLKLLDLPQAVAVLGHELGHVQSDHMSPRVASSLIFAGGGALAGNEFARAGGLNFAMHKLGAKFPFFERMHSRLFGAERIGRPASLLGSAIYIGLGLNIGSAIANNISIRPTELDADVKGARISGDPASLAGALRVLQGHAPRSGIMSLFARWRSGYPSTETRIRNLENIAAQGQHQPVVSHIPAQPVPVAPAPAAQEQSQPVAAVQGITGAERLETAPLETALT